jgi:hypothetical protein
MNEIHRDNLIIGKIYYIVCLTDDEDRNLIPNKLIPKLIGTFLKHEDYYGNGFYHTFFNDFRAICEDISKGYKVRLNLHWRFYEAKKYDIQQNMENRALNLVLRNIIKDEYFYIEILCKPKTRLEIERLRMIFRKIL